MKLRALGIEAGAQPLDQRVVAVRDSELLVRIFLVFIGAAQRRRADAIGVRGVEALRKTSGHLLEARRQLALPLQEFIEGDVVRARRNS